MSPFSPRAFSDQQLIAGIREGGKREDRCLRYIYQQNANTIIRLVLKNQGTREEGAEIFQEAVIVLYEKIKHADFQLNPGTRLSTYLYSIAKNKWLYKQRGKRHMVDVGEEVIAEDPWDKLIEVEKRQFITMMLDQLGKDCKKILIFSLYEQRKMVEISQLMGFKNAQIARNKKHKCLKYLKEIILRSTSQKEMLEKG